MTVVSVPVVGEVYRHRLFAHQEDNPEYCAVVVLAVVADGARTWVMARYWTHRAGRRDAFTHSVEEFNATYATRWDDEP